MITQADEIREKIARVLQIAKEAGAVVVTFKAQDVSRAIVGAESNHPNVISALTSEKMKDQTGFAAGTADRDYQSSAALISFKL